MKAPVCIYHAHCADGLTAAAIFDLWYEVNIAGDPPIYRPMTYQDAPPSRDEIAGRDVYILDFSLPAEWIREARQHARSILLLDHHKSALPLLDIEQANNTQIVVRMDLSGAGLAWDWFFPEQPPRWLVQHVQDRDLWRFHLPGTRAIHAALLSRPMDLTAFRRYLAMSQVEGSALAEEGKHIIRAQDELCHRLAKNAFLGWIYGRIAPICNAPHQLASDIGHLLCKDYDFAAVYSTDAAGHHFSLRSDGKTDVARIAAAYGGGGHANAAGFFISRERGVSPFREGHNGHPSVLSDRSEPF